MAQPGKILVTGATGNIGKQLITQLVAEGVDVRALMGDRTRSRRSPGEYHARSDSGRSTMPRPSG